MNDPWNIKTEYTRQEDSLPTFIIFCEDEISEPIYFKYFETSSIKVNPIKNQKSKFANVKKAISYCESNGLMVIKDGLLSLQSENTQVWCVYDRDVEETIDKIQLGNIDFDEAIETAIAKGFKVAWSNDSFELWILLHFENIDASNVLYKNRESYYERLTDIFRSLPNPNQYLINALRHPSFSYKQDFKHENNFRNIARSEIVGKTNEAIARAIELEKYHSRYNIPNHDKSPCTLVHHLVEELIRLGGKKI